MQMPKTESFLKTKGKMNTIFTLHYPIPESLLSNMYIFHGGRGHWAVYYTSPQSFMKKLLFLCLTTLETIIKSLLIDLLSFNN